MSTLFAAILLLCLPAESQPPPSACETHAQDIRAAIRRVHEKQKNVGLAAVASRAGRVVFTDYLGFADIERQVPVSRSTRFAIASVTKAFTGVALLKLWEKGAIDLDAPIQRYVPSFPVKAEGTITPRLLAAHLAGIRHWKSERTPQLYATHFDDVSQILPLFQSDPLVSAPGAKYSYSSYGYDLLGAAIEQAARQPYTTYVEKSTLRPLDLRATGFDDVRRALPDRAARYSYYDPSTYTELTKAVRVPDWDYSHNLAGGNMISTAEDLARFGTALTRPGFLSGAAWQLLFTRPRTEHAESPMSFGWFVSEKDKNPREIHTSGSNPGVQAALYVFPDQQLTVAVLSNTWGIDSRSGEMVSDLPREIAGLCGAGEPISSKP
jgi:CubicO group peptidase (beta-lactamase class C family)